MVEILADMRMDEHEETDSESDNKGSRLLGYGTLYILGLEDPSGGRVPPFYKIGVTTGPLIRRVRTLQTGNPFRIIVTHQVDMDGCEVVEKTLHEMFSKNRRILEWFSLTDLELKEAIERAHELKDEFEDLVSQVRVLDLISNVKAPIQPTKDAISLYQEALRLESQKIRLELRRTILRSELESLTRGTRGIDGITKVMIYDSKTTFKLRNLKSQYPDIYEKFMIAKKRNTSLKLLNVPTKSTFTEEFQELKNLKRDSTRKEDDEMTTNTIGRNQEAIDLHSEYIALSSDVGDVKRELRVLTLKMKVECGDAQGIIGICEYKRDEKRVFDKSSFEAEYPDLYSSLKTESPRRRVFQVSKSRDYI